MSKLLPTRLPQAQGDSVSVGTFNRLVRVLEINLGSQDPDNVGHFSADDISELQFTSGAIIFNTTVEVHQAFDGNEFRDLYTHQTYPDGVSATFSVGSVTVTT
jgi:hypothetical protein|tara:strand:- start:14 stop:322 length:309 start_codon:yes stop_codon:yes gene_type:complete